MLVDDGAVVFAPAAGSFAELNESATELWLVMSETAWSAKAATQHLIGVHAMGEEEARRAVELFIRRLELTNVLIREAG